MHFHAWILCALAATIWGMPSLSHAAIRCDCSKIVDECRSSIAFFENAFHIRSDHPQCSRVAWFVNEQPQTVTVTDGEEVVPWLGAKATQFGVRSCDVCVDHELDAGTAQSIYAPPKVIALAVPEYPPAYLRAGVEGTVRVRFDLGADGQISNVEVISSPDGDPTGAWLRVCSTALRQSRIQPAMTNGQPVSSRPTIPFSFRLDG
jgi:TonB family protein